MQKLPSIIFHRRKSFVKIATPGLLFRRDEVLSTIWYVCCEKKWYATLSSREQHWVLEQD